MMNQNNEQKSQISNGNLMDIQSNQAVGQPSSKHLSLENGLNSNVLEINNRQKSHLNKEDQAQRKEKFKKVFHKKQKEKKLQEEKLKQQKNQQNQNKSRANQNSRAKNNFKKRKLIRKEETKDNPFNPFKEGQEERRKKFHQRNLSEEKFLRLSKVHKLMTPQQYKKQKIKILGNYHKQMCCIPFVGNLNDERLTILDSQLFLNKQVLDIGCGEGMLTLEIAIKMFPKNILGVDIDKKSIQKAKENVKFVINKNQKYQKIEPGQKVSIVKKIQELPIFFKEMKKKGWKDSQNCLMEVEPLNLSIENEFPKNIQFECQNVFLLQCDKLFDTIICMNVLRYIHLSFGDDGVIAIVEKMTNLLKPKGILIIQYHYWFKYKERKRDNPLYADNYKQIIIRPEDDLENVMMGAELTLIEKKDNQMNHLKIGHGMEIYQKNEEKMDIEL